MKRHFIGRAEYTWITVRQICIKKKPKLFIELIFINVKSVVLEDGFVVENQGKFVSLVLLFHNEYCKTLT